MSRKWLGRGERHHAWAYTHPVNGNPMRMLEDGSGGASACGAKLMDDPSGEAPHPGALRAVRLRKYPTQ